MVKPAANPWPSNPLTGWALRSLINWSSIGTDMRRNCQDGMTDDKSKNVAKRRMTLAICHLESVTLSKIVVTSVVRSVTRIPTATQGLLPNYPIRLIHREWRSVVVGTNEHMAVWDAVAKIAEKPLFELLAQRYGDGPPDPKIFVYA